MSNIGFRIHQITQNSKHSDQMCFASNFIIKELYNSNISP